MACQNIDFFIYFFCSFFLNFLLICSKGVQYTARSTCITALSIFCYKPKNLQGLGVKSELDSEVLDKYLAFLTFIKRWQVCVTHKHKIAKILRTKLFASTDSVEAPI